MEQVFTQEQIETKLEQLGMEVEDLMYEDVSIQLAELTRIRDEISTLINHLQEIPEEPVEVLLRVDKVGQFENFCADLLAELLEEEPVILNTEPRKSFEINLDGVEWKFEPNTATAYGTWRDVNEDNGYFTINDLAYFGELSIE